MMYFLRTAFPIRFLARVFNNYPSILFCIFLILGQLFAFFFIPKIYTYFIFILILVFIISILSRKLFFISFFIIGIFSYLLWQKNLDSSIINEEQIFLGQIVSSISTKKISTYNFDIKIFGIMEKRPRTFKEVNFAKTNFLMNCTAVALPWNNITKAKTNSTIIIKAKVKNLEKSFNPFSYESYLLRKGINKTCNIKHAKILNSKDNNNESLSDKIRKDIKKRTIKILGDNESSGLFLSMTIGVRNLLSEKTEEDFKKTGLTHLLVVSGYQVCLIFYTVLFLLKQIPRFFTCLYNFYIIQTIFKIIALCCAIFFVLISGSDSSSIRASIAIIILSIANIFERNKSFANTIILSFFILHLLWPLSFLDPGIALSYSALFGIWLGSFIKDKIKCFIFISLYVYITTSIITLIWFKQISLISFFLNLTIAPIISWISCNLGFLGIFLNYTIDPSGYFIKIISYFLDEFKFIVLKISEINFIYFLFETPPVFLILLLCLLIFFVFVKRLLFYKNFWGL